MKAIITVATLILVTSAVTSVQASSGGPEIIVPVDKSVNAKGYTVQSISVGDFSDQTELIDPEKLDNSYFTVVENQGTEPLSPNDADGSNVLYHMMKARNYYASLAQKSGFEDAALDHKIVVRVRVDHAYNPVTHFDKRNEYDNSRYIPAEPAIIVQENQDYWTAHPDTALIAPWNQEISFDQRKTLNPVDWYSVISGVGTALAEEQWIALTATPMQLFENYNAGIDGAKIPDVIYHETFHYATDAEGYFPMASEGNPVAEDYANYFGSSINGLPKIAEIGDFSGKDYKHGYDQIKSIDDNKPTTYNATSFGPSVFWQIRKWLGQERADQLIWNSLHWLKGSLLHLDVPVAVSAAAHADADLSDDEISEIDDLLAKYHSSYENLEIKFNDGETKIISTQDLTSAANQQASQLESIPDELKSQGVYLPQDTIDQIGNAANRLRAQSRSEGFRNRVVGMLNRFAHGIKIAGEDTAKAAGFLGNAIFAITDAPADFGTDFATGLFLNSSLLTQRARSGSTEVIGATGAIGTTYSVYAGLSALGFTLFAPISTSALGAVVIDSFVCAKANLKGNTSVDRYCAENSRIVQQIDGRAAVTGAIAGKKIHEEFSRIIDFFKNHSKGA